MAGRTRGPKLIMTPDDVLLFVQRHVRKTSEPVVTTRDVSAEFGCSIQTARDRLETLVDQDKLGKKKAGEAAVYYLLG